MSEYHRIGLSPGESALFAADFTPHQLMRHVKTGLVVTENRVAVRIPQYIAVFFNVGYAETTIPLRSVAAVTAGTQLDGRKVLWGSVSCLAALWLLATGGGDAVMVPIALVAAAVGAFLLWSARDIGLTVNHHGGQRVFVKADATERGQVASATATLTAMLIGCAAAAAAEPPSAPSTPRQGVPSTPPPTVQQRTVAPPQPHSQPRIALPGDDARSGR